MTVLFEEFIEDIACQCEHCSGEVLDLVMVDGILMCLACAAMRNGKAECA
jgi:hypothetical protein